LWRVTKNKLAGTELAADDKCRWPPIWAVISSTMLEVLRSKGFGLTIISPITNSPLSFVGYSFVDDTDLLQSNEENNIETIRSLQKSVDTWEGCLKATGGALGPEKSYWYLVTFQWNGGKWTYAPATNTPDTIFMKDINNVRMFIRRIQPNQAEETLGVWISPNGNTRTQYDNMLEKSLLWVEQMKMEKIKKQETWLALQSTILRT
jgi:hypothetical protein